MVLRLAVSLGHLGLLLSTKTVTDTFGLNIKKHKQINIG